MSSLKDFLNRWRKSRSTAPASPQPTENLRQAQQTEDWDRWNEVQTKRESQKSVRELHRDAYTAYRQGQRELAASLFGEAAELARQQGDPAAQAENLHWKGETLRLGGHLEAALHCLLLADNLNALDPADHFRNLLDIVAVGNDLPLPLPQLEDLFAKLEPYKGSQQLGGSKSMVLYEESLLLYQRGKHREALARSQEAFASRVSRAPCYDDKVYFGDLVGSYRLTGQYAEARAILRQWKAQASYHFADEKSQILMAEAKLLYAEGHTQAAWDTMQQAYAEERYIQRAGKNYGTLEWMIRIGSELGHFEQLRPLVLRMLHFRHAESRHARYSCHISLARYCCHVCIRGGLSPKDTARMHRHARFWLRQADTTARHIDRLLECDWRTKEVQELLDLYNQSL